MWTAGWVEPGDKWIVAIIPLSSAPNPWVGPLTVQWHLSFFTHLPFFSHTFGWGGGLKTVQWESPQHAPLIQVPRHSVLDQVIISIFTFQCSAFIIDI